MEVNEVQEEYPIHFKDNIDKYLWHEHGILGGCCSAQESLKYSVAREVVEKLTDTFIKKACSGIEKLLSGYIIRSLYFRDSYDIDKLIEDFKTYMKEV